MPWSSCVLFLFLCSLCDLFLFLCTIGAPVHLPYLGEYRTIGAYSSVNGPDPYHWCTAHTIGAPVHLPNLVIPKTPLMT